ncbi:MAG: hypothetical protein JWN85_200 [Gammaproteobacteria bacterium]|nr:hypothetical protein [Gammaproteobacteria bacterium]
MKKKNIVPPSAYLRATAVTAAVLTALYGAPDLADDNGLTEVTVTATRRASSAQNIPISITAVTGEQLEQAGIQDISGLARSMAGVLPGAVNVGNAYSRGIEAELFVSFNTHLSGQVDYTYDQTKLTSYNQLALGGLSVPPPPVGSPLPGTPKNSLAVGLTYGNIMIGSGELRYAINAHYQSSVVPALSATIPVVPGYTMVDTRLSYTLSHWAVTAYCNNLTNNLASARTRIRSTTRSSTRRSSRGPVRSA